MDDQDVCEPTQFIRIRMKKNKFKNKCSKKLFWLDVPSTQLIEKSNSKKKRSLKIYPFAWFKQVQDGCRNAVLEVAARSQCKRDNGNSSEGLNHIINELKNRAFTLFFETFEDCLYLIAPDALTKEKWIKDIRYIIENKAKMRPQIEARFQDADKNNDNIIDKKEIRAYLQSINLKLNKSELEKYIQEADTNHDGVLDKKEFKNFFTEHISCRTDLYKLFVSFKSIKKTIYMTLDDFVNFVNICQKENKSIHECKQLIYKYEPSDLKFEHKLTFVGFDLYLSDSPQHLMNPEHEKVYQLMNLPLNCYYINSSHNTYLVGDQLRSDSTVDCYISALKKGCRLLEIDVHESDDGEPMVYHKKTLTSKIRFEDVIIGIKHHAFDASEYPLILTLENSCSIEQDRKIARYIYQHLKEYLYLEPVEEIAELPRLNQLKRKILIRGKKKFEKSLNSFKFVNIVLRNYINSVFTDRFTFQEPQTTSDLINLCETIKFKSCDHVFANFKPYQGCSIKESDCLKVIETEPIKAIHLTNYFLMKTYPGSLRVDSSNFDPLPFWISGFQIVALNFQKKDDSTALNKALFNDNGNCGYVVKPSILKKLVKTTEPLSIKMKLKIIVISAQDLPLELSSDGLFTEIADSYVAVSLLGLPIDQMSFKTDVIRNNGYNPIWNQECVFYIRCPELAFIKFSVKDKDVATSDQLGKYVIRVGNMRQGFRRLNLENKLNQGTLFIYVEILNEEN